VSATARPRKAPADSDAPRSQLLAMPSVLFAGYKVPHPLHPYFLLKVQTDGSLTPREAVTEASLKLLVKLNQMETAFRAEFAAKAADGGLGTTGAADEPYGVGTGGGAWGANRDYMDF
jgi:DNA-directed RNA polymerase II subunit RPB11